MKINIDKSMEKYMNYKVILTVLCLIAPVAIIEAKNDNKTQNSTQGSWFNWGTTEQYTDSNGVTYVKVNGKEYAPCNGNSTIINDQVYCNGNKVAPNGQKSDDCKSFFDKMKEYLNFSSVTTINTINGQVISGDYVGGKQIINGEKYTCKDSDMVIEGDKVYCGGKEIAPDNEQECTNIICDLLKCFNSITGKVI